MKTVDEIRELFLEFFERKNHTRVASDSLVPHNDPTLLFTGAGMNQFKDYFLGLNKDLKRAASSQKCLRTADLDEVGRTPYHHSFFEMLGNFSFGDYFKKEAIEFAWEFLTVDLKIPKDKLRISVHEKDDEAFQIWKKQIGIPKDRIYKRGDTSNFWPANATKDGPNGPCGPCSEIYYDQGPEFVKDPKAHPLESGQFTEIWNLVFTQYDRQEGGVLKPLAQKNIDTGMGLERLACVLQGKNTNYEIDIFQKINAAVTHALHLRVNESNQRRIYAISDHLRAVFFSITDGVIPSNEGRGYVIRKLIRRALWHGYEASETKMKDPFLFSLLPTVTQAMGKAYPELKESESSAGGIVRGEEERFLATMERGLEKLKNAMPGKKGLSGEFVFELYDTYGFPLELTRQITESKGIGIDEKRFDGLMEAQRKRAKESTQIATGIFVTSQLEKDLTKIPPSQFLGYAKTQSRSKIVYASIKNGQGLILLDQTPFYGESGGQVGDHGVLENKKFRAHVVDTQKKDKHILHFVRIEKGEPKIGDEVQAAIVRERRNNAMRNHTATHLLHAALRSYLGKQVRQLGSLVSPEKLRFDYSYPSAPTREQIRDIENLVNRQIWEDRPVTKEEKDLESAREEDAIAFFGEKYGKKVRVITIGDFSKELCGGTHCDRTGQIGLFVITSDSSIASGTRRMEALTGAAALEYVRQLRQQIQNIALSLKTAPSDIAGRIVKIQETVKKLEKEKKEGSFSKISSEEIIKHAKAVGKYEVASAVLKDTEPSQLVLLSDDLRLKKKNFLYFLGSSNESKISFILGMSPDLKASNLNLKELAPKLGQLLKANSGGRPDLIQGGAANEGQLESQQAAVEAVISSYLREKGI